MRKVKGFTILETEEEVRKYCGCSGHEFKDVPRMRCINPKGEFVVGYGNSPMLAPVEPTEEKCVKCGYIKTKEGER